MACRVILFHFVFQKEERKLYLSLLKISRNISEEILSLPMQTITLIFILLLLLLVDGCMIILEDVKMEIIQSSIRISIYIQELTFRRLSLKVTLLFSILFYDIESFCIIF